jgi:hypothetical protein
MSTMSRTDPANPPVVDPAGPAGPTDSTTPPESPRYARLLTDWPLRRRIALVVLGPVLFVLMVSVSGSWALANSSGWTAVVALIAVSCATTLATYLPHPGTGLKVDVGCTPCAAVAAVSVLAAFIVLGSAPHDVSTAVLALGVSAFGLVQRLNNPSTCPA